MLAQPSLYRQAALRDAYEIQTKANIYSELELLKFRDWSRDHNDSMLQHRGAVEERRRRERVESA